MANELILGFQGQSVIAFSAFLWIVCIYGVYRTCLARSSGGIPLAYAILLLVIHAGSVIYLLPWYDPLQDPYLASQGASLYETAVGTAISTLGMIGLTLGIFVSDHIVPAKHARAVQSKISPLKFSKWLIAIGAAFFFLISPVANRIPSGASIASQGVNLAIVGICLFAAKGMKSGLVLQIRALITSMSLPGITMLFMGFVGYGITAVTEIGCFVLKSIRIRWWAFPIALLLFWFALSFYVTYMTGRERIRESVWKGASYSERFSAISESFLDAQLFDVYNTKHLHLIDTRINQNALVGRAFVHLQDSGAEYGWGESIGIALVAWIPRIVWPDKPVFGGSGLFVSRYTGMVFDKNTSVGVGLVLELFANFGLLGTFAGFVVFGILIRSIDLRAASGLNSGNLWDFALFQLLGFAMIQPGGFLAECVASVAAGFVLCKVLKSMFSRMTMLQNVIALNSSRNVKSGVSV